MQYVRCVCGHRHSNESGAHERICDTCTHYMVQQQELLRTGQPRPDFVQYVLLLHHLVPLSTTLNAVYS